VNLIEGVTSQAVTSHSAAADADDVQAVCLWDRLAAAQCCHLEMERQFTEEHSRQIQMRVAERIRRAAKRIRYIYLLYRSPFAYLFFIYLFYLLADC